MRSQQQTTNVSDVNKGGRAWMRAALWLVYNFNIMDWSVTSTPPFALSLGEFQRSRRSHRAWWWWQLDGSQSEAAAASYRLFPELNSIANWLSQTLESVALLTRVQWSVMTFMRVGLIILIADLLTLCVFYWSFFLSTLSVCGRPKSLNVELMFFCFTL